MAIGRLRKGYFYGGQPALMWAEMLLLFAIIPSLYYFKLIHIHFILLMAILSVGAATWLYHNNKFYNRSFGLNGYRDWHLVWGYLALFMVASTIAVYCFTPDQLFGIIRQKPFLWAAIMGFYPVFSAYPQELLFRGFFIERYHHLFKKRWVMIVANGLLFGMAHLMFGHWLSVVLSAFGGMFFAALYLRHRSILLSAIVHALFGNWIFTVGMGHCFYLQHGH